MTDSKGKLTDPAWLKNELNWAKGADAEMKEAMLNQWTESHEGLVFKPEAQRRIRDQQEDKSALNSLVNEFLDSSKSKGNYFHSPLMWICNVGHPDMFVLSSKKRCRYCRLVDEVMEEHPIFRRRTIRPSK